MSQFSSALVFESWYLDIASLKITLTTTTIHMTLES